MKRRRLMLVGLVALAAIGLWVGWLNRLSEDERKVVGTWYRRSSHGLYRIDFFPDRTHSVSAIDERTGEVLQSTPKSLNRWGVRDSKLIFTYDRDLGFVDRARRMLPASFPGAVALLLDTHVVERLTADELILRDGLDNTIRMTRTPPE